MGKRFHKNSVYILILRLSILLLDLIGINIIFALLLEIFQVNISSHLLGYNKFLFFTLLSTTWFVPSMYFKTYEGNLKIAYNLKNSIKQLIVHLIVYSSIEYLFGTEILSITFYGCYSLICLTYLPFCRYLTAFYLNKIDNYIPLRKRVTILGSSPFLIQLQGFLEAERSGCRLIRLNQTLQAKQSVNEYIFQAIHNAKLQNINEIYSFIAPESNVESKKLILHAEKHFIRLRFIKNFSSNAYPEIKIEKESDIPLLENSKIPLDELDNRIRKRLFDIIFSVLVIILFLSWLWPIIAILIYLDSKGPILFKQVRTGKKNLPFTCYKFRTMVVNSSSDTNQALINDSRFTRVGKFLRKTSLDELPQFINVLKGEMSIIGPRPHMLHHTHQYENLVESYMNRHFIKPGISGWAQINGLRGNLDQKMMAVRVQFDLEYIRNWSFWVDLDILFKTLILTISGDENAY